MVQPSMEQGYSPIARRGNLALPEQMMQSIPRSPTSPAGTTRGRVGYRSSCLPPRSPISPTERRVARRMSMDQLRKKRLTKAQEDSKRRAAPVKIQALVRGFLLRKNKTGTKENLLPKAKSNLDPCERKVEGLKIAPTRPPFSDCQKHEENEDHVTSAKDPVDAADRVEDALVKNQKLANGSDLCGDRNLNELAIAIDEQPQELQEGFQPPEDKNNTKDIIMNNNNHGRTTTTVVFEPNSSITSSPTKSPRKLKATSFVLPQTHATHRVATRDKNALVKNIFETKRSKKDELREKRIEAAKVQAIRRSSLV